MLGSQWCRVRSWKLMAEMRMKSVADGARWSDTAQREMPDRIAVLFLEIITSQQMCRKLTVNIVFFLHYIPVKRMLTCTIKTARTSLLLEISWSSSMMVFLNSTPCCVLFLIVNHCFKPTIWFILENRSRFDFLHLHMRPYIRWYLQLPQRKYRSRPCFLTTDPDFTP